MNTRSPFVSERLESEKQPPSPLLAALCWLEAKGNNFQESLCLDAQSRILLSSTYTIAAHPESFFQVTESQPQILPSVGFQNRATTRG